MFEKLARLPQAGYGRCEPPPPRGRPARTEGPWRSASRSEIEMALHAARMLQRASLGAEPRTSSVARGALLGRLGYLP